MDNYSPYKNETIDFEAYIADCKPTSKLIILLVFTFIIGKYIVDIMIRMLFSLAIDTMRKVMFQNVIRYMFKNVMGCFRM